MLPANIIQDIYCWTKPGSQKYCVSYEEADEGFVYDLDWWFTTTKQKGICILRFLEHYGHPANQHYMLRLAYKKFVTGITSCTVLKQDKDKLAKFRTSCLQQKRALHDRFDSTIKRIKKSHSSIHAKNLFAK